MQDLPLSLQHLIEQLARLPGIGAKTAQKIAYNLVEMREKEAVDIARAIVEMKKKLHLCSQCHFLTEEELCKFCSNPRRDPSVVCVVDTPRDLLAIERTREFKGLYHVLHGRISPLEGVRPQDLFIDSLEKRVDAGGIEEIILANSPTLEGEATAVYLSKLLQGRGVRITRIAHGVPVGGDLEFSDEITLLKAIEGRHTY
ncbi:MAG: recombination protein RecR [Tissierellia bacterium]|nr:recombination mediator RecR [Bacillota bacterium]NLL23763.1 recombination protein RecR [Tissierellia bacterium]